MAANSEPRIEPVLPMPAPEPIPAVAPAATEPRRNPILPANDDRRASVQELLEPLRQTSPRTPYWLATAFSASGSSRHGCCSRSATASSTRDGTLRSGIELPMALAGIGVVLPILFVFALAALHRRSRDLRNFRPRDGGSGCAPRRAGIGGRRCGLYPRSGRAPRGRLDRRWRGTRPFPRHRAGEHRPWRGERARAFLRRQRIQDAPARG